MSADIQNAYKFLVLLDPTDIFIPRELITLGLERAPGAFQSCNLQGAKLDLLAYPEGGRNDYVHQLPVRHSWERIKLSKGIAFDPALFAWYEAGLYRSLGARRDGAIVMLERNSYWPTMVWTFSGGLAATWAGPDLNAGTSAVAIERLEIAHEGLKCIPFASLEGKT
jgi:phage tail-like protein